MKMMMRPLFKCQPVLALSEDTKRSFKRINKFIHSFIKDVKNQNVEKKKIRKNYVVCANNKFRRTVKNMNKCSYYRSNFTLG